MSGPHSAHRKVVFLKGASLFFSFITLHLSFLSEGESCEDSSRSIKKVFGMRGGGVRGRGEETFLQNSPPHCPPSHSQCGSCVLWKDHEVSTKASGILMSLNTPATMNASRLVSYFLCLSRPCLAALRGLCRILPRHPDRKQWVRP